MVKILIQGGAAPEPAQAKLSIWAGPAGPILRLHRLNLPPVDYPITSALFAPWTLTELLVSRDGRWMLVTGQADAREGLLPAAAAGWADPAPYATIAWGATAEDLAVVTWRTAYCSIQGAITAPGISDAIDKIETVLPGFAAHYGRRSRAKRRLVAEANPLDSLAALEKQLDLLSELVLSLLAAVPPEALPAWVARYQEIMVAHSSVPQAGGADAALTAVGEHKERIRGLVDTYFAERSAT